MFSQIPLLDDDFYWLSMRVSVVQSAAFDKPSY